MVRIYLYKRSDLLFILFKYTEDVAVYISNIYGIIHYNGDFSVISMLYKSTFYNV